MIKKSKKTVKGIASCERNKSLIINSIASESKNVSWCFDRIDRNGCFSFDINRKDFDTKKIISKMIDYSNMTWIQVKQQTHDKSNKSKNHFLEYDTLSKEAKERVKFIRKNDEDDLETRIFSFSFNNVTRVIGIVDSDIFHVVWYDPNHNFCPVTK